MGSAQKSSPTGTSIQGKVVNSSGDPVPGATVFAQKGSLSPIQVTSGADGSFSISSLESGAYTLRAEKPGIGSVTSHVLTLQAGERKRTELMLVLMPPAAGPSGASGSLLTGDGMELSDSPTFAVAGVTDWSNAGGHGSDIRVRTGEALAKETVALKGDGSSQPAGIGTDTATITAERRHELLQAREEVQKALAIKETSQGHKTLGDLDEQLSDSVAALREYEIATRLDPAEANYFAWGAELLVHKAALPAAEVFRKGVVSHPASARMLAGLGAALYAAGAYEDAAGKLCEASDMRPSDPAPYMFLGRMQKAATATVPCVEPRLARWQGAEPNSALANYYYAVALWKRAMNSGDTSSLQRAEALLGKAVNLAPNFAEARLQLGILQFDRGDTSAAIGNYEKTAALNPQLAEPHFRLAAAYKRAGEQGKADRELALYKEALKAETAEEERKRHELQQFVVVMKSDAPAR